MQTELDAANTAISELASGAQMLTERQEAFLKTLDEGVANVLRGLETYIHPDRVGDIRMFYEEAQKMGQAIQGEAAAVLAKATTAHEALIALDKARAALMSEQPK